MDLSEQAVSIEDTTDSNEATVAAMDGEEVHIASSPDVNTTERRSETENRTTITAASRISTDQCSSNAVGVEENAPVNPGVALSETRNVDTDMILNETGAVSTDMVLEDDWSSVSSESGTSSTVISMACGEENENTQQDEQQIENAGIDPNYPLVVVQRVSLPSTNSSETNNSSIISEENVEAESERGTSSTVISMACGEENENTQQDEQQIENAGIDPNYPLVVMQRVSLPSTNSSDSEENVEAESDSESSWEETVSLIIGGASLSLVQTTTQNVASVVQQDEQQMENAGIDPNYPLVLIERVALPSIDNSNNDDSVNMEEDNIQPLGNAIPSVAGGNPPNRAEIYNDAEIAAADEGSQQGAAGAGAGEDSDEDIMSMLENDEDEVSILENRNVHDFYNQFVVIRNMIEQTRRSMAEAEANFGPSDMIPRNTLMQRFRRILFILNNRRRRLLRLGMATPDEENSEGEANAEMEAANEENSNAENEDENMTFEEEELNENAVRFDTNLPVQHSYLGDMCRVTGVNYYDDHQLVKLRLFLHEHILFPGEVLPFMVHNSTSIMQGDEEAQNGIVIGVCFPSLTANNTGDGSKNDQLLYGVTCQIYELGEDDRDNTLIKSRALQRFVVKVNELTVPLEYINSHPRMTCLGYVRILPDVYLPEPFKRMPMGSMNRFRDNKSMVEAYRRFQAASTPWPAHVYESHNIAKIVEKARTQLAQHKIDSMPTDATQLSYWLLRNLHLPEHMLKAVFLANTVNKRLKLIATTFQEETIFSCRSCSTHIANCRELFAMSKHGVQSQYCNSAGYIHETNTVYQVKRQNIMYSGSPSAEYSWFPGYQWHIIVCKICEHHLGWEFKAVEPNLIPRQFFGISSSCVRIRSINERVDEQAQTQHAFYNFIRLMNGGVHIEE